MITRRVARFERFVLTPLSFLLPIAALVYFFNTAWWVGAYLLFAWFCVGVIGQSMHKDKGFDDLARGGLTAEENIRSDSGSLDDARQFAKPALLTSWLFAVTTAVLLFHHGFRWFVSIAISLLVGIVAPMIFVFIFARPKA